jgi:hypothetical protein
MPETKDLLSSIERIRSFLLSKSTVHQLRKRTLGIKSVEVSPATLDFSFQRCNGLVNNLQITGILVLQCTCSIRFSTILRRSFGW